MNRIITFALAGLMVVVAAMGWLLGISPLLDEANGADEQRSSVAGLNDVNQAKVAELKTKFENLDEITGQVAALRTSVPERLDIPALLREINGFCASNGVTLVSLTVDTAEVLTPAAEPAAPADAAAPAVPDDATVAPVAPTGPVLVRAPIQVTVLGDYAAVMAFAGSLQTGPRLFLAKSFAVTQSPEGSSGVLGGFVYALPLAGADVPASADEQAKQDAAAAEPKG
jgi:Tfp pilus assembly protein PilO